MKKIAIGTAQFGMPYGIANQGGQISVLEASAILSKARKAGIDFLDTAITYGNCEQILGELDICGWQVVTKLPGIPQGCGDVHGWILRTFSEALKRLKLNSIHALLLHKPDQLLGAEGESIYGALQGLRQSGVVKKIGPSIYSPDELESFPAWFHFDIVQTPFNILDRRLLTSGWLGRLKKSGVEVLVRSVFLQGLLLMRPESRPQKFKAWDPLWSRWHEWLHDTDVTALQACLGFALSQPEIDRIIVGVDSLVQLEEILSVQVEDVPLPPSDLIAEDALLNPSKWSIL